MKRNHDRMPAYVYKCKVCEYTYEKKKRFSDPHDTECPECDGEVRRVINSVGIVFKGSGFYVNDSKSSKAATSSSSNGSEKSDKSGSGEKGEKKGDSADSSSSSDKKESKPKETKKSEPNTT